MALPTLDALRKALPDAHLTGIVQSPLGEVLTDHPSLDSLFSFKRPKVNGVKRLFHPLPECFQSERFDAILLLTNSFSTAWEARRAAIPVRVGYKKHGRSLLLNPGISIDPSPTRHQVDLYRDLLTPFGIVPNDLPPHLPVLETARERVSKQLLESQIQRPLVGINPGAAYGSAKCWLPERFREVVAALTERGIGCVLFGTREMKALNRQISEGIKGPIIDLTGRTTLPELVAWIASCDVLLTNDSGPMHVAAAVGTPPVALFGSTSDAKTSPYGLGRVIHKHVSCSPCYKRTCPIDFKCMRQIGVQEVVSAILDLLDKNSST